MRNIISLLPVGPQWLLSVYLVQLSRRLGAYQTENFENVRIFRISGGGPKPISMSEPRDPYTLCFGEITISYKNLMTNCANMRINLQILSLKTASWVSIKFIFLLEKISNTRFYFLSHVLKQLKLNIVKIYFKPVFCTVMPVLKTVEYAWD